MQRVTRGRSQVVVLSGGFGGLKFGRWLAKIPVEITRLDRRDHHRLPRQGGDGDRFGFRNRGMAVFGTP